MTALVRRGFMVALAATNSVALAQSLPPVRPRPLKSQPPPPDVPDSGMVVRFDLTARTVDAVAKFVVPTLVLHMSVSEDHWVTAIRIVDPLPWTDDWTLLADGAIARIERARAR